MSPATFREARKYARGDIHPELVAQAASQLHMKLAESSPDLVKLTARLNLWSFGERVTVVLASVDRCSLVDITSSCVLITQFADWGKNEQNVKRLFGEIDKALGDDGAHERCPQCRRCGYLLVGIPAGTCPECGHQFSAKDEPRRQDTATVKNAVAYVVVATAIELTLIFLLSFLGVAGLFTSMFRGARGALFLLCINLGGMLSILGMHHLVKRYTRRK